MAYRETPSRPVAARWIRSSAGLRVATGLLGVVILGFGVLFGAGRDEQLVCDDGGCEVRSAGLLRPTEVRRLDPARPPAVVLSDARYGKNGSLQGKALSLRWPDRDMTVFRGDTATAELHAAAVRRRLSEGRGALSVGTAAPTFAGAMGIFLGLLGLAMTIEALGFGVRRRVSFDAGSRILSTHLSVFGLAIRRRLVVVPPRPQLVSLPVDANRPLSWLAIAGTTEAPQPLGMLDVPMYRQAVEEVLRDA